MFVKKAIFPVAGLGTTGGQAGDVDPGVGGKHAHGSNLVEAAYRSLGSTAHRVG